MAGVHAFSQAWLDLFALHAVECSAFILLVWGIDRVLDPRTEVRYGLWSIVLAKVFIPPFVTLPGMVGSMGVSPFGLLPTAVSTAPANNGVVVAQGMLPVVLLGLWSASTVLLLALILRRNLKLTRILSEAAPVMLPLHLHPIGFDAIAGRVFSLRSAQSPILFGLRQPRLILPDGWDTWPEAHLRGILNHEMAHLQRGDRWALAAQNVALVLFGYNPLIWLIHSRLNHLRELLCDESAVRNGGIDPADYGKLLLGFLERERSHGSRLLSGTAFVEQDSSIIGRFRRVLAYEEETMGQRPKWQTALIIFAAILVLPFSCGRQDGTDPAGISASKAGKDGIVQFFELEKVPVQTKMAPPRYPAEARVAGIEGAVFVQYDVTREGVVENVTVLKGPEELQGAAIRTVEQWRYEPGYKDGGPVRVRMTAPIRFSLGGDRTAQVDPASGRDHSRELPSGDVPRIDWIPGDESLLVKLIKTVPADYPRLALKAKLEGVVVVSVDVGADGKVTDAEALDGHEIFRQTAVDAAKQYVFAPPTKYGEPAPLTLRIPIRFELSK